MKKIVKLGFILLITVFTSCQKDGLTDGDLENVNSMNELKVPESFNWKTDKDVNFDIKIAYDAYQGAKHKISIYNGNPFINGQLIQVGSVSTDQGFTGTLRIPSYLKQIYILNETPKGMKELVSLNVNGNSVLYTFQTKAKSGKSLKNGPTSPDCSTGCDETISSNGYFTIKNNKTYCISGNFNGSVQFEHWNNGGKLRICGNATFSSISMGDNSILEVTSGGILNAQNIAMNGNAKLIFYDNSNITISTVNMNQTGTKIENYSSNVSIGNSMNVSGVIDNHGTMDINGSVSLSGNNGTLYNYGTFTAQTKLEVNHALENSGSIIVTGDFKINNQAIVKNYCKISCTNIFEQNNSTLLVDNGYIYAGEKASFNNNISTILKDGSMISSKDIHLNSGIVGQGATNTIKSSNEARINGLNYFVNGAIEWADNNGVLDNGSSSNFINGATFKSFANATNIILASSCNPEGIGNQEVITDSDGDGVPNNLDEYPNDATRAYNSWYPSQNTWGTLAYEDLWPKKGDYDFNDMVISYNIKIVTNAQNKIVEIQPKLIVKAVGATIKSGFGFQFDNLNPSEIASITGNNYSGSIPISANGTESGTNKAVVIAFDKPDQIIHRVNDLKYFNTLKGTPKGSSDTLSMRIIFTTPLAATTLGSAPYNPFIFRTSERGHEVHLPNYIPTSKADLSLFNTMDDGSIAAQGKYYRTSNNLPWAININETFEYPAEYSDITQAYLKFAAWAQSGGTSFPDWYKNQQGYRNSTLIY